ncbi:cation diffusion facilitator family transporter [Aggregatilinea lenta]|uniref:cation diffusion facilitator family transporter n=1 Tax=Aggregatilinea lenta TaxID=913108 RepID=UPI000E5BF1DB|nr:cation diffusion facilitator family transporter [Aggregatilinea lenta]
MSQVSSAISTAPTTAESVRRVLWIVLVLNVVVAGAKLATGLLTGAVAMIADGFHSSMDASSNIVGLVGTKLAAQPPDEDHPYGHRRFETLATLAIGGLLLVAAWEILQTMLDRLLNGGQPDVTAASFVIMFGTMIVNLGVTIYERRRGHALHSDILLADAAHTSSDFFVSLSVIASLALSSFGFAWSDIAIALLIVLVIGRAGVGIIRQTSNILADQQTLDPHDVQRAIQDVPGLDEIVRVRSRGPADAIHVDIDARIQPAVTTDHAYAIARTVRERLTAAYPQVEEVQVNFVPQKPATLDYGLETRAVADGLGLRVHEVIPVPAQDGVVLEMHVEVRPGLTLGEAHRQASELERRLAKRIPSIRGVITHIEPSSDQGAPISQSHTALELRDRALDIAQTLYPDAEWCDASIRLALGGYALTLCCRLPGSMSVEEAHGIAEHVEAVLRTELPLVQRITIHTEPVEDIAPVADGHS